MADNDARNTMKIAAIIVGGGATGSKIPDYVGSTNIGLDGLIKEYGIGGVFYQLFNSFIAAIDGAATVFLAPFRAFGKGLGELVEAIVTAPISIVVAGAENAAYSLRYGSYSDIGPGTFAVAVAAVMLGLLVFTKAMRQFELRPWKLFRGLR